MSRIQQVVVVGSGPNGLSAALEMVESGLAVTVVEGASSIGGGTRTEELTLPGFRHDVCSAIHPLGVASPFFKKLPLEEQGLRWITPPAALAHPFEDGTAAILEHEIAATVETLDFQDRRPYTELMSPLKEAWGELAPEILAPIHLPAHPLGLARFGIHALRSADGLARSVFHGERARALFGGMAAHSFLPLERPGSASFGLVLGVLGHVTGWPVASGGSSSITGALARLLVSWGGEIVTRKTVASVEDFTPQTLFLLDLTPRQVLNLAGHRFPDRYCRTLRRYRYGSGVFKVDWALAAPIPWRAPSCLRAATVHVGGTLGEIAAAEQQVWQGLHPERPFVLVAQQSLFDPDRAPNGMHTGWAYCHVPNGSPFDMTDRIERQVERFAPGFRELILARHQRNAVGYERYNPNFVGGDINGGVQDLRQILRRPVAGPQPYATPDPRIFICSSSTPPGGGVHGMCGFHAARCAIRNALGRE